MTQVFESQTRCSQMIARLNREQEWGLSETQIKRYAAGLAPCLQGACSDATLRTMIINYHRDHTAVEVLVEAGHQQHFEQWNDWMEAVLRILTSKGLDWSTDKAVNLDDLSQIALTELAHSIQSFRYQSRFSTWAYQVIVGSVRRHIRDSLAGKRAQRPESFDLLTDGEALIQLQDHPEIVSAGQLLVEQTLAILSTQPDRRLKDIFELWAVHDRSIEEIGRVFQLHPSRIRALLQQARQVLRDHPTIRTWRNNEEHG